MGEKNKKDKMGVASEFDFFSAMRKGNFSSIFKRNFLNCGYLMNLSGNS